MKNLKGIGIRALGATAVAISLATTLSQSAQAAGPVVLYAGCDTTGASGFLRVSTTENKGPDNTWQVHIEITDTLADRRHAQARLVTTDAGPGNTHYWAWHYNNSGSGTVAVNTTAHDSSRGIAGIGIQTARGYGSTVYNSCISWT